MKPTNHTQHLVHQVSYICKCMRTQDLDFTGSLSADRMMNCVICKVKSILCPFQIQRVPEQAAPHCCGRPTPGSLGSVSQGRIPACMEQIFPHIFVPSAHPMAEEGPSLNMQNREGCLLTRPHPRWEDHPAQERAVAVASSDTI